MTISIPLLALAALLVFAAGVVACDVLHVVSRSGRRTEPVLDLTVAAARGELIELDWSDPRGRDAA